MINEHIRDNEDEANMSEFDHHAAILVFDDADLIDIAGPREVLSGVTKPAPSNNQTDEILAMYSAIPRIKIDYIAISSQNVGYITTADGTSINYDHPVSEFDLDQYDIIVLPGGKGIHYIKHKKELHEILKTIKNQQIHLISVCTGAYGIAESGILTGQKITTHHRHYDIFEKLYPEHHLIREVRFVEVNEIIVGGGVTSGFDATLRLIEKLYSKDEAIRVANRINYQHHPN